MTNSSRMRTRLAAGIAGIALAAGLLPALATSASASVLTSGDGKSHVRADTPWKTHRGSIAGVLGTTIAALAVPLAAAAGTQAVADIPKVTGDDGEKFRGAYSWVSCPFNTANKPIDGSCRALQGKPDNAVKIEGGKVVPTGSTWVATDAQGALFGKTNTLSIPSEADGTWLTLAWTAQVLNNNGAPTGVVYSGQSPESILVVPQNPSMNRGARLDQVPVAGKPFTASGFAWDLRDSAGAKSSKGSSSVWLCTKSDAMNDTSLTWDIANGCTRLVQETPQVNDQQPVLRGTLPADSAGKYVVINGTSTSQPSAATTMAGGFSWQSRTAAFLVSAPGAAPAAASGAAAGGAADTSTAAAPTADSGATAGAAAASTSSGTNASSIATGAGVDLAKSPLVDATGRGTGAAAKLTMGLAASAKVNRGRYITVTAALTPKSSNGKVRIVLARTNAKGKVIASKALYATLNKGRATKRWQIPRKYAVGNYTVVASYVPSKKGAAGVTATAPVQIG